MAKARKPEDKDPVFHATAAYKQWVWDELGRKRWTQQQLVDEMKRADRSQSGGRVTAKTETGTLAMFLGARSAKARVATNTDLMPSINKALGIAPPSVCNPNSALAQIKDHLDDMWNSMDDAQRLELVKTMEGLFGLSKK